MEFIQFNILGGFSMTIKEIQEKERGLAERVARLKGSIAAVENSATVENIEAKAEELNSLQTQLNLTEVAYKKAQEQLKENKKLLDSKEYKDKLKMQEKLREQATSKTRTIYEKLAEVQAEAKEVFKLCNQYDKLNRETSRFGNPMQFFINLDSRQPFSWLRIIAKQVHFAVDRAKYIKDKLEV